MKLVDIYSPEPTTFTLNFLYWMLKEREPVANISHRSMPTGEEHAAFVNSKPYEAWYIIEGSFYEDTPLGNCYLTRQNEIGVHIIRSAQGQGYGRLAIKELMMMHGPRRYLANIAPANMHSQSLFIRMGFRPIQMTFELDTR